MQYAAVETDSIVVGTKWSLVTDVACLFQSMKKTSAFLQFFLRRFYLFFLVLISITSELEIIHILSSSNQKFTFIIKSNNNNPGN